MQITVAVKKALACCLMFMTCILFINLDVQAGVVDEIAEDFSPVSGYVVKARDGEFLIDLDGSDGIVVGDIFSVVSPGEKLIHPVSGEVLGNLEEIKGHLKVTRIKTGFSHARSLDVKQTIDAGDQIRRYEHVNALFWDFTGNGKDLFLQLRNRLPALKWMEYEAAQALRPAQPGMAPERPLAVAFAYTGDRLEVQGPEAMVLRAYQVSGPLVAPAPPRVVPSKPMVSEPSAQTGAPTPPAPAMMAPAKPRMKQPEEKTGTITPVFPEMGDTDELPGSPKMIGDFAVHDGKLLLATTDGHEISVFDVTSGLKPVAEGDSTVAGTILFLSWWQPVQPEGTYLATVTWSDNAPVGKLFRLDGNRLTPVGDRISKIIGAFDIDGDNRPETLLGQEYEPEEFFGIRYNQIKLSGNSISYTDPPLPLPRRFTVTGSLITDLTQNGQPESGFIRDNIFYIYSKKDALYKSGKQMGGSINILTYDIDPEAKNLRTNTVSIEIPPVVGDLDGDGAREILVVSSDRSFISATGIAPGINKSWLTVLKYQNGDFNEGTLGENIKNPVQALTVFDGKVFMMTSETGSVFAGGGKSRLQILPLAR